MKKLLRKRVIAVSFVLMLTKDAHRCKWKIGDDSINENEFEIEKKCSICGEIVRSDATVHEFCKLCGMGISDPELAPKIKTANGEVLYFCCDYCVGIYKIEIEEEGQKQLKGGLMNEEK
jgi:hypothetical protein